MRRNLVAMYHEMFDGSRNPAGLSAAAIPLEGRIMAVAAVNSRIAASREVDARFAAGCF